MRRPTCEALPTYCLANFVTVPKEKHLDSGLTARKKIEKPRERKAYVREIELEKLK